MCVPYTFNLHRINRVSGRARNANTRYVYTLGPSLRFRSTIWEEQREKERRRDARAFASCHRIVTPVIYDSINKSATFYPFSFSLSLISTSFNPWRRFLRTLVRWFWGLHPVYHPWIFLGWNQPFFFFLHLSCCTCEDSLERILTIHCWFIASKSWFYRARIVFHL